MNIKSELCFGCGPAFESVVQAMEEQHDQIATLGREVDAALAIWRTIATVESREALAAGLERLLSSIKEHLRDEEERGTPRLHRAFSEPQQMLGDLLPSHTRSALPDLDELHRCNPR